MLIVRNTGPSCDGVLFWKIGHVWSDGFRHGRPIRNVHGLGTFLEFYKMIKS